MFKPDDSCPEADAWVNSLLEALDKGERPQRDVAKSAYTSALNRGYMAKATEHRSEIGSWEGDVIRLSRHIEKHLQKHNQMPCRVSEMTPREHELFKMLAAHNGLLMFLCEYLYKKGNGLTGQKT